MKEYKVIDSGKQIRRYPDRTAGTTTNL